MTKDFQPSKKSLTPAEEASSRLRYICRAAESIEAELQEEGHLPPWALDQINQAARAMGMALSYVAFSKEKKFQAAASKASKAEASKAEGKRKKEKA